MFKNLYFIVEVEEMTYILIINFILDAISVLVEL